MVPEAELDETGQDSSRRASAGSRYRDGLLPD
jgi:hypothetical protein